jgi:hypothetical protein
MFNTVRDLAMFMLYLVALGLILVNADEFGTVVSSVGGAWVNTLQALQVRA